MFLIWVLGTLLIRITDMETIQVGYWTPIDKFVVTRPVMFAGRTFEPPEYQLKNLKGRHLRLGIDVVSSNV